MKLTIEPTNDLPELHNAENLLSGVCQSCSLWEPEKKLRPDMANMGYCPLFDKRTRFNDGKQCTGHSDLFNQRRGGAK